jgi:hypothetical protein
MAYDPKDPEDKKIVDGLIADALAEQATEHETAIAGLKDKNKDLLGKLAKANKGEGDPAEVARLETELEGVRTQLATATRDLGKITKERDKLTGDLEGERNISTRTLVDKDLTNALVENKIAPQFLPAAKALLASKVSVKTDGETRSAVVGDKSLGDFIKEWSLGDEGKHYVAAPVNGGGNSQGTKPGQAGAKQMARSAFRELSPVERQKFSVEGGQLTEG